ncbi:hypothetical protein [Halalkalibacter oceani]|uniref:hypothetical protein n=1 Tax=Halalkalibacter oceani TaxID=1653776 RepID=UPI00339A8471
MELFSEEIKELQLKKAEYEAVSENLTQKVYQWASKICPDNKEIAAVYLIDKDIYILLNEKWLGLFPMKNTYTVNQFIQKCKSKSKIKRIK